LRNASAQLPLGVRTILAFQEFPQMLGCKRGKGCPIALPCPVEFFLNLRIERYCLFIRWLPRLGVQQLAATGLQINTILYYYTQNMHVAFIGSSE
jgi:hypothetical protein